MTARETSPGVEHLPGRVVIAGLLASHFGDDTFAVTDTSWWQDTADSLIEELDEAGLLIVHESFLLGLKKQINVLKTKLGSALAQRDNDAGYDGRRAKREAKRQEKVIAGLVADKVRLRDALQAIRDLPFDVHQSGWAQADAIAAAALSSGEKAAQ